MDERRVIHLYLNLCKDRGIAVWEFLTLGGLIRSGLLTTTLLAVVVLALFVILHERGRGHLTHLKQTISGEVAAVGPSGPQPGGMDPLIIRRPVTTGLSVPEFASMTLLPGLGMSVLQITARIPGRGEVALLAAPSLASMSPGTDGSAPGNVEPAGLRQPHGQFELPWSSLLSGTLLPQADQIGVKWQGRSFSVPHTGSPGAADGGLMSTQAASDVATDVMIDGGSATGNFDLSDFDGHWPGKTKAKITVLMVGSRIEITVVASNVGGTPEPMGIGWQPRFTIAGDRQSVQLKLPEAERLEVDEGSGLPTGRVLPAASALVRFMGQNGATLNGLSLHESLANLKPGLLEDGPQAELRFPNAGYGLRLAAVSTSIRSMNVTAHAGDPFVSLGLATNYPDPLGREWEKNGGSEMVTLVPGQSIEWRIKLDVFALSDATDGNRR